MLVIDVIKMHLEVLARHCIYRDHCWVFPYQNHFCKFIRISGIVTGQIPVLIVILHDLLFKKYKKKYCTHTPTVDSTAKVIKLFSKFTLPTSIMAGTYNFASNFTAT